MNIVTFRNNLDEAGFKKDRALKKNLNFVGLVHWWSKLHQQNYLFSLNKRIAFL